MASIDRFGMALEEKTFVVHPEHADHLRSFIGYVNRYTKVFVLSLVIVAVTLMFGSVLVSPGWVPRLVGMGMALIGASLVVFPFSTPETAEWLGVRRSITVVRVLGNVIAGGGLAIIGLTRAI